MTCPERSRRERYCGRNFSEEELILIRALIAQDPRRTRADLSRLACQAIRWLKPDGGLKDMSCRVSYAAHARGRTHTSAAAATSTSADMHPHKCRN
jgi:hypothetical protein